jgi:hypothetical protein
MLAGVHDYLVEATRSRGTMHRGELGEVWSRPDDMQQLDRSIRSSVLQAREGVAAVGGVGRHGKLGRNRRDEITERQVLGGITERRRRRAKSTAVMAGRTPFTAKPANDY